MAHKEQKGNTNDKKAPNMSLKEKRVVKQEKAEKKYK